MVRGGIYIRIGNVVDKKVKVVVGLNQINVKKVNFKVVSKENIERRLVTNPIFN